MKRAAWLCCLLLGAADTRATPSSVDKLARAIATWVADDEPVALRVRARTPDATRIAELVGELLATRAEATPVANAQAARDGGFVHFADIEIAVDATDVRAFGRIVQSGRDLWAEAAGTRPFGVVGTFVVGEKLDPELRAYLGPAQASPPASTKTRKLAFRAVPVGTVDLGAAVLDATAADLDGDGKAELAVLTVDEVVVFAIATDGPRLVARAQLEGPPPVPRARAPVGAIAFVAATKSLLARSSEHGHGASFTYAAGTLTRGAEPPGYPVCPGESDKSAELVPGQHLFSSTPKALAIRCRATVDAQGVLHAGRVQVPGVGAAFVVADFDGDGTEELVTAGFHPPGTPDTLSVYTLGDSAARLVHKSQPTDGGVAAMAAGDFDGDGLVDFLAIVRGAGTQVSLWRFD